MGLSFLVLFLGLLAYFVGYATNQILTFDAGLAVTILGLTMLGNITFHEYWVEKQKT